MFIWNNLEKLATCIFLLAGSAVHATELKQVTHSALACFDNSGQRFSEVLACYRQGNAAQPLNYTALDITRLPGIEKRRFELTSQDWSPAAMVQPTAWKHEVTMYIPDHALGARAVIVANNGINIASGSDGIRPFSDMTEAMAINIARQTRTINVSVSNVPNQYLRYTDDDVARREDSSVAHSWKLFLQSPRTRPFMSLHVPMMQSIVKAMDLAHKELQPWHIQTFIATGASKRGWAVWLAALADPRIDAIVPFVIDILDMGNVLEHTYRSYGRNWPLAFGDYHREGVTTQRSSTEFDQLLQIEDPLRYLESIEGGQGGESKYMQRLAIPKYIVNASGDDFFVPDNTRFYFDRLPGIKALRVAPNASHYGIRNHLETSLVTFINRIQLGIALPTMQLQWSAPDPQVRNTEQTLQLDFSEQPSKIVQWVVSNAGARDFRYACGIRYTANPIEPQRSVKVALASPQAGWTAAFVEAEFSDGFVITTPVRILPDSYPEGAPPESGPACKTIAE